MTCGDHQWHRNGLSRWQLLCDERIVGTVDRTDGLHRVRDRFGNYLADFRDFPAAKQHLESRHTQYV